MESERQRRASRRAIARAAILAAALLLSGCVVSLGVTNSPPTPDQCGPGKTPC